jgi:hypothetical protein
MALAEHTPTPRELILLYAAAGGGKTRLATSLPARFGEIIYFALDDGSEDLDSVLHKYRPRIHVIKPDFNDPIVDAGKIAVTDWRKQFPEAKTIVLDTFSNLTWKLLNHVCEKGLFQAKHNSVGTPGTPMYTALPDKGDYGGVHGIIRNFVTAIIKNQPGMNIIMVCHQDTDKDELAGTVGGPATVGRAMIEWLPARFKTVIRLDRTVENAVVNGAAIQKTKYIARTSPHGAWIARINEASETGNPIPYIVLNVDPINFWIEKDLKLGVNNGGAK